MSLIAMVLVLIGIGFLLWLVETYIPMNPMIKRIIEALVVIVTIIWILQAFGILPMIGAVKVMPVR